MEKELYHRVESRIREVVSQGLTEDFFTDSFRSMWHLWLQPPDSFTELKQYLMEIVLSKLKLLLKNEFSELELKSFIQQTILPKDIDLSKIEQDPFVQKVLLLFGVEFKDIESHILHEIFHKMDFQGVVEKALEESHGNPHYKFIVATWQRWKPRVINLSTTLISSIKDVHSEYISWIKKHPDAIDKIAWEAFERLIAEVFASRGFYVDLTGRLRNRSADILAVRTDEFGVETKYLIECKRYDSSRRVGFEIVNAVIGAARRAKVDHAFLVTSSYFTKDVVRKQKELVDIRLHLMDGDKVRQWLREYKVRSDGGLWLSNNWEESWPPQ